MVQRILSLPGLCKNVFRRWWCIGYHYGVMKWNRYQNTSIWLMKLTSPVRNLLTASLALWYLQYAGVKAAGAPGRCKALFLPFRASVPWWSSQEQWFPAGEVGATVTIVALVVGKRSIYYGFVMFSFSVTSSFLQPLQFRKCWIRSIPASAARSGVRIRVPDEISAGGMLSTSSVRYPSVG